MPSTALQSRSATAFKGSTRQSLFAFEEAAAALDLEPWIVQRLRHPIEESTAYLQVHRDSGEAVCAPLFSVHHSEMSGRTIGGLSLRPDLQLRDCQAMAMERTWQAALLGLPFSGAFYGLVCDPAELSEREMVAMARSLGRHLCQRCPDLLLLPDRGCCREFMARVFAGTRGLRHVHVTGTPNCMGGLDPALFIAEGIAALISTHLRHRGKGFIGAKIALQGFDVLGQAISRRLLREGMQIVAIADNSGGVYRADGLILADVRSSLSRENVLLAYTEADHISRAEIMGVEADALVLTSGPKELRDHHCRSVSTGLVVEATWEAVEDGARALLTGRGTTVAPWFVATGGSLLAAYGEVLAMGIRGTIEELLAKCYRSLSQATEQVLRQASEQDTSFEQAAFRIAVDSTASYLRCCGPES
jgi:glutamate dehydrogenase (NAD(P)+)